MRYRIRSHENLLMTGVIKCWNRYGDFGDVTELLLVVFFKPVGQILRNCFRSS